jgi:hypothetical protein
MPNQAPNATQAKESPLDDALSKNEQATQEVVRATEDLAVVHAVLDTNVSPSDVKRAIAETKRVEERLVEAAEKMEQVNDALEREIQATR